jgi:hypothetical protein
MPEDPEVVRSLRVVVLPVVMRSAQRDDVRQVEGISTPAPGEYLVAVERSLARDVRDEVPGLAAPAVTIERSAHDLATRPPSPGLGGSGDTNTPDHPFSPT